MAKRATFPPIIRDRETWQHHCNHPRSVGRLIYKRWALRTPLSPFRLFLLQILTLGLQQHTRWTRHCCSSRRRQEFLKHMRVLLKLSLNLPRAVLWQKVKPAAENSWGEIFGGRKVQGCVEEAAQSPCPGWRGDVTGLASGTPQPAARGLAGACGCPKPAHVPRDINTERDGALGARRSWQLWPRPSQLCPQPPASAGHGHTDRSGGAGACNMRGCSKT